MGSAVFPKQLLAVRGAFVTVIALARVPPHRRARLWNVGGKVLAFGRKGEVPGPGEQLDTAQGV